MEAYLRLRRAYTRVAMWVSDTIATPESLLVHLLLIAAWLIWGWFDGFSTGWNFVGNQTMTIESDLLTLFVLTVCIRSGKVNDAKQDQLLRDIHGVGEDLIGLQDRPDEPIPTIEPHQAPAAPA